MRLLRTIKQLPEWIGAVAQLGGFAATAWSWVTGQDDWVQWLLWTLTVIVVGVTAGVAGARRRWFGGRQPARRHVDRLLSTLHERWWPDAHGHGDRDYRVSMFVPEYNGDTPVRWKRRSRSAGEQKECVWEHVTDPEKLSASGIVVCTALRGEQAVDGVPHPKQADEGELRRYRHQTCVDEKQWKDLGWRHASIRTYISRAESGKIIAIFVVERESGNPIELAGRRLVLTDAEGREIDGPDLLATELQVVTEVWATTWGES